MSDDVYVRHSPHTGGVSQFIRRYHTDTNCQHVGDNPQPIDRDAAERRRLSLCQRCASDAPRLGGGHDGYAALLHDPNVSDLDDIPQAIADRGGDA